MYLEIDEGFLGHRKTVRLCTVMRDANAFAYLLRLWTWACRSSPEGSLDGLDGPTIESICGYRRLDGKLYDALVSIRWIDTREGDLPATIHNWSKRTGGAIERMEERAAEKKELARVRKQNQRDRERMQKIGVSSERRQSNQPVSEYIARDSEGSVTRSPRDTRVTDTQVTTQDKTSPDKTREGESARAPAHEERVKPGPEPYGPYADSAPPPVGPPPDPDIRSVEGLRLAIRVAVLNRGAVGTWSPGARYTLELEPLIDGTPDTDAGRAELRSKVAAFAASDDPWIRGKGWNCFAFVERYAQLSATPRPANDARRAPTPVGERDPETGLRVLG